eukprot:2095641-Amphidinium_carterae.1
MLRASSVRSAREIAKRIGVQMHSGNIFSSTGSVHSGVGSAGTSFWEVVLVAEQAMATLSEV